MRRGETTKNERVIITTYVESTKRLHPKRERIKAKPFCYKLMPQSGKTNGYDRKAQLLAYAKDLRNSNSQHLDCPTTYSISKSKKRRCISIPSPSKLSHSIFRLFHRNSKESWRYKRIDSEGNGGLNVKNSQFCGRLRKLIKVWSSACNCKRSVL